MSSVFISYAHRDGKPLADRLHSALTGAGYQVFKDDRSILPGESFPHEIAEKVATSDYFVLLNSEASRNSSWVREEIAIAKAKSKRIVPIWTDDAELPHALSGNHALDMRNRATWWEALDMLVNSFDGGEKIPRVYNLQGRAAKDVEGVLVLGESIYEQIDLADAAAMQERAVALANEALPVLKKTNAGIACPGHSALASAVVAYIMGAHKLPKIYWPFKNANGNWVLTKDSLIDLQQMRYQGDRNR